MARVARIGLHFRHSLDAAGITSNPAKRVRVGEVISALERGPLPMTGDYEALLPWPGSTAWAHSVPGLRAWVLYAFDDDHVEPLWLATHEPILLE